MSFSDLTWMGVYQNRNPNSGRHRGTVDSQHKVQVMQKMYPCYDAIMTKNLVVK